MKESKNMNIAEKLSVILRFPTIAGTESFTEDPAAFAACRKAIHGLFPKLAENCERHLIAGRGLVYHWRGQTSRKPWVLMAHYDVVPAPQEGWDRPPFSGDIEGGFVHGRGAVDTKGSLAAMLEAAEGLIAEGFVPPQDIYFCFSADEETYGPTTGEIIRWLKARDASPDFVLDEGGWLDRGIAPGYPGLCAMVGVAEKGMANITLSVSGQGGHASQPPRESQAIVLAKAIARLHKKPWPMAVKSPVREALHILSHKSAWPYRLIYRYPELFSQLITGYAKKRNGLLPLFQTTCAVTQLKGSDAANVLPATVTAGLDLRILPGESREQAAEHVRRAISDDRVKVTLVAGNDPSPVSETTGPAFERICRAAEATWPGILTLPELMTGATDAYHYSLFCPRVYRFSPMMLSAEIKATVHATNERIPIKALEEMVVFYRNLMKAE